jgi:hypothetical protein
MQAEMRQFFHGLFGVPKTRRRLLVAWQQSIPVTRKRYTRLADFFQEFLVHILYESVALRLRKDHFCLFGNGSDMLSVRLAWLAPTERSFLAEAVVPRRTELFRSVQRYANGDVSLEGFVHDPRPTDEPYVSIVDPVWRREIVRDFASLLLLSAGAGAGGGVLELALALQRIMVGRGDGDLFVTALHGALQRHDSHDALRDVTCWAVSVPGLMGCGWDRHSEDEWQRKQHYPAFDPTRGQEDEGE